nr:MAG TPA: hypothetical protein [Caudoviricetes sp.]
MQKRHFIQSMKCLFLSFIFLFIFLIGSDELPKSECYHHSYVSLMTKTQCIGIEPIL